MSRAVVQEEDGDDVDDGDGESDDDVEMRDVVPQRKQMLRIALL